MLARAETVIVGGGIAGVALSHFLTEAGVNDILLLEADRLASGCTGASMGGVRQQFSTPEQVELALRGRQFWKDFEARFGTPLDFHVDGYLLVTAHEETYQRLRQASEVQRSRGADNVHVLGRQELREVAPWMEIGNLLGGTWTPDDGRMNPTDGLYALAAAARRRGARFVERSPVQQIERASQGGWHLDTPAGRVQAQRVVVACGLATPQILRPLGVDLPITPMPFPYAITGPALSDHRVPLTIDLDSGFFVDRHGSGLTVTVVDPDVSGSVGQMLLRFGDLAAERAPSLTDVAVRTTATAVADATGGDGHPFIGEVETELWVMSGFDAHGTMQAPAIAEVTANWILGEVDPFLNPATFNPWRTPSTHQEWLRAEKH